MISIYKHAWKGTLKEIAVNAGFNIVDAYAFNSASVTCFVRYIWSPHIWAGGVRNDGSWTACNHLVLDFDSGEMSLSQAIDEFEDFWHVIGTTKSHQKSKNGTEPVDRFRVILKLDKTITDPKEYALLYSAASYTWPCDPACSDLSRAYYPCIEIESKHLFEKEYSPLLLPTKELVDLAKKLERARIKRKPLLIGKKRTTPIWVHDLISFGFDQCTQIKLKDNTVLSGRNNISYIIARNLRRNGQAETEAYKRIHSAILDWVDFTEEELQRTVESAFKGVENG